MEAALAAVHFHVRAMLSNNQTAFQNFKGRLLPPLFFILDICDYSPLVHFRTGFLAARVSSGRLIAVLSGALRMFSGLVLAVSAISIMASMNSSKVSLLSLSVGSIMSAP